MIIIKGFFKGLRIFTTYCKYGFLEGRNFGMMVSYYSQFKADD